MSNPKALVTGASSGIGLATAQSLFSSGYSVEGIARDFSNTDFDQLKTTELDLSQIDDLASSLQQFRAAPDVLVLNAGYGQFGGIEQFSHDQIRRLVDTNLVSNLFLIKHFLPKMKQQGSGDIVLIGSESAVQGAKAGAVYCATKFAIRGLAQSLRADSSTAGIRVILVNPGPVNSDFFDQLNFEPQPGKEFEIPAESVADAIMSALQQPRSVVVDEINMQPIKRSFRKK
ncbi:MAG: 3-hydroxy acid dehydrogenase/malonic semialdehyde reductase [Arenicella sp.]|jgi:3-hydroxy acid dehydrogenase/malonic semialdehyde reductase